ncbi:MAG: CoA-binding protein [Deltaproteobacteria bacterium HGW-Deltaproteobacteria-4]|nr:MAG: CoA-binding protein [Deltaproteobacteria bacterium HGW-Deltaproteobacteria-4]
MTITEQIAKFLSSPAFAVAGASTKREKYGNMVVRCYQQQGKEVIPLHPLEKEIEGLACVTSVKDLPPTVKSLSMITPPQVTEKIVAAAIAHGIENIWMQPGAESAAAVELCREQGVNVIADGSCILVVLGFRGH